MKDDQSKNISFYCYRYFVVHSGQQDLFSDEESRKRVISNLISNCIKAKNISVDMNNSTYMLLHMKKIADGVNLFKFSRDSLITTYQFDEQRADIIEVKGANYPFIYVIIDSARQIVLLEYKSTVFQKVSQAKNAFQLFLVNYVHDINYTITLQEISNSMTFWDAVSEASKIFEITLSLKSPNFLGSKYTTNELLKEVKSAINNDETEIKFKNNQGNLNVNKEHLEDPLKYAGNGGGSWKIRYIRKGTATKRTLSSQSEVKTIEITDSEEEFSLFSEDTLIEEIKKISEAN